MPYLQLRRVRYRRCEDLVRFPLRCLTSLCVVFVRFPPAHCTSPPQNLPLSYQFAYILTGTESALTGSYQTSNTLRNFVLPSGGIVAVVYVRDSFGGAARTTVDASRVANATVQCNAIPAADVAARHDAA